MQAQFQQSYADSSAEELLEVLHQLDVDRLHAALHQAMAVQSGELNQLRAEFRFLKQSQLIEPCDLLMKVICPSSTPCTQSATCANA